MPDDKLNLADLSNGTMITNEVFFFSTVTFKKFSNGEKEYVLGTLKDKETSLTYKSFDEPIVQMMKDINFANKLAVVEGKVDHYNGEKYLKISSIALCANQDTSDYIASLDCDALFTEFAAFLNSGAVSPKAINLLMTIFNDPKYNLRVKFKTGYAAKLYHDNIRGGLIHHTLKGLRILRSLIENDKRLQPYADLLYIAWILHDIGKTIELDEGVYTANSFVTHVTFAVEMIAAYKDTIVQIFDEGWYYRLLSCITGHHGKWGDPPNTVWAYILHLVDMLESRTTTVLDTIENKTWKNGDSGIKYMNIEDYHLTI